MRSTARIGRLSWLCDRRGRFSMMISLAHAASVLCPPHDDGRHFVQGDLGAGTRWGQRGRGKKGAVFCVFTVSFGSTSSGSEGGTLGRRDASMCRVEKLQEWNSHVPDSVGSRKMQNLRWDFVQNVIIRPRKTLAPAKGGAGGVGMTPPNWNRQLWRHQCRSHFPANPDGPVRGLRRLTASGGELVFWDLACHSTAFKHCRVQTIDTPAVALPRFHLCIVVAPISVICQPRTAAESKLERCARQLCITYIAVAPPLSSKERGLLDPKTKRQNLTRPQPVTAAKTPFPQRSSRRPPAPTPTALQKQDSTLHPFLSRPPHRTTKPLSVPLPVRQPASQPLVHA